jgi:hypothetical protein
MESVFIALYTNVKGDFSMRKIFVLFCLLLGVVLAMGDKPVSGSDSTSGGRYVPLSQRPIGELSADQLYTRAYAEYGAAMDMANSEQNVRAIKALELFLQKYSADERSGAVCYYLVVVYARNNQPQEQKALADAFFAAEPTKDALYDSLAMGSLSAYVWSQETQTANAFYTELQEKYPTDNQLLASIHQDYLAQLEVNGDVDGQKKVFNFFRSGDNRRYLKNPHLYYIYTYRLAVIYYNEGDQQAAEPLFKEVAAQSNTVVLRFFAESAQEYLKNIGK